MGIIARQTIKGSIYSYIGAFIGFVNVALIMPHIFSSEEIGLVNLLIAMSSIVGQLGCLGFTNVIVKFFPYFRNHENRNNGFSFLLVAVGIFGSLICSIGYFCSKDYLIAENIEDSKLFADYVFLLLPLVYITIFHLLVDTYNRLLFNASFGLFVKEFLLRILNLIGIILFYLKVLDFNEFIIYYVAAYGIPTLLIVLLLIIRKDFSLHPSKGIITKDFVKQMCSVALFGIISSFSGVFVMQIDRYLINHYCDLSSTGIYSIAFYFGSMILLPGRSLIRISSSVIAESLKRNDYCNISKIFKKSTTNMMIIGTFLFIMVWGNINNILKILPPEYSAGKYVILFIALSHLFQMCASVSGEIIQYSKYYRQYAVIMIVLIGMIFGFNLILLPSYGIIGAAIASTLSFFIYFIIRIFYVKLKFGFQPFQKKHIFILITAASAYAISLLIPDFHNFIVDIIIRSAIMGILFIVPTLYFNFSEELTSIFIKLKSIFIRNK